MLSFPAPKWRTTLAPTKASRRRDSGRLSLNGARFGRAASLIVPRVYLSDYFTARDSEELARLGITHIISVLEYDADLSDYIPGSRKIHVKVADSPDVDILTHLPRTTEFITSALSENDTNKVLVHCFQGVSRSATVVCAYLVATSDMLASEAIAHTQAKRGIVQPNPGFMKQLNVYAQQFVGKRHRRGKKGFKIGGDIAERIRQLRAVIPTG